MHNEAFARRTRGRGRRTLATIAVVGALGAVSTTTSAIVPAIPAHAEATAQRSETFVYTVSSDGDYLWPEGVAVQDNTYYVTGFGSGNIYRGDLEEREAEVFIHDVGFGLSGIKVVGEHLIVARGGDGVSLFDRTTGALEATWSFVTGSSTYVEPPWANDVAIALNGDAYITDSGRSVLYRIPAAELQSPSSPEQFLPIFLEWPDPPFPHMEETYGEANGIVATPDGKYLLVVHFTDGSLFRVRLSDKQVRRVDLGGYSLFSGDGMVVTDDNVLYVVRPARSLVAKIHLNGQFDRGRLLSETRDPTFHGPTTAVIAGNRLLVVNSQFSGPPSAPPWTVSSIRIP
jgi:Cu-Zn family superoxide dismutase